MSLATVSGCSKQTFVRRGSLVFCISKSFEAEHERMKPPERTERVCRGQSGIDTYLNGKFGIKPGRPIEEGWKRHCMLTVLSNIIKSPGRAGGLPVLINFKKSLSRFNSLYLLLKQQSLQFKQQIRITRHRPHIFRNNHLYSVNICAQALHCWNNIVAAAFSLFNNIVNVLRLL